MLDVRILPGVDDARFGQETLNIINNLGKQLCAVLRYSVRGGQAGLEAIASRFVVSLDRTRRCSEGRVSHVHREIVITQQDASLSQGDMLEGMFPANLRQWMLNGFIVYFRTYSLRVPQPPDSEIMSLLVYKDASSQQPSVPSVSTRQSATQAQSEDEVILSDLNYNSLPLNVHLYVCNSKLCVADGNRNFGTAVNARKRDCARG